MYYLKQHKLLFELKKKILITSLRSIVRFLNCNLLRRYHFALKYYSDYIPAKVIDLVKQLV